MDDLERLFRELVNVIRETEPERLRTPFQISELYQKIIPYRGYKTRLGFESNEDYDMTILRMLAGERGYASVEPEEVREQLALEAEAINPTPGFYREFAAARVRLNVAAVGRHTGDQRAYAPPDDRDAPETNQVPLPPTAEAGELDSRKLVFEAVNAAHNTQRAASEPESAPECGSCGHSLPDDREFQFCPFCGSQLRTLSCARCGDDVEVGWRFCGTCGQPAVGT